MASSLSWIMVREQVPQDIAQVIGTTSSNVRARLVQLRGSAKKKAKKTKKTAK